MAHNRGWKGAVACIALFTLAAVTTWGAPYGPEGIAISWTQPGGAKLALRVFGDEFYARTETADGYTVVFDEVTKAYMYAELSADGQDLVSSGVAVGAANPRALGLPKHLAIPAAAAKAKALTKFNLWELGVQSRARWNDLKAWRRAVDQAEAQGIPPPPAPPSFTTTGNRVGLTLLIDFEDDPATIPQADVVSFCNGDSYTGYGNNGSVKKYFLDNSNNSLTYTNVVTAYVRIPNSLHPKSYYNDTTKDAGDQANELIRDAIGIMKALPNYAAEILPTFDSLTVDGSNQVVACNVFYAGDNGGRWTFGLWPHSWSLYNVGAQSLSAGGKKIFRYQITNIGSSLQLGTFCHENGHMLCGFPDIYDYDYDSTGGAGGFCLMNSGGHGSNPVLVCAYLKRAAGWTTETNLIRTDRRSGTLVSTVGAPGYNTIYRYANPAAATEYFLFENRTKAGRDANIASSGIAIWHIDELGDRDNQSLIPNDTHANYEVTLVQADNLWHFQNDVNSGDSNDLYYQGNTASGYTNVLDDASSPNAHWWDGTDSGLSVFSVSDPGNSMTLQFGPPAAPVITGSTSAIGAIGAPFSYQIVATNGPTSYSASPLPAGLSLNSGTGLISGIPTASGTTTVNLSATNDFGTGTGTLTIEIGPLPSITSSPTAAGVQGSPFAYQILATDGPITGYGASPLPAGLSLNATSGLISGTPTVPGTTSVTLTATNAYGTGTATLALVIHPIPTITSTGTIYATQGLPFAFQIVATDGPILNYSASPLPGGLSVDPGTGLISGLPATPGTTLVTLGATNAYGTGTAALTLIVDLQPEIAIEHPTGTGLADNSTTVNFGNAAVAAPFAPRLFTIRNTGLGALRNLAFTANSSGLPGDTPGDFVVDASAMSSTLAPGGSTTFKVTFSPGAIGDRSTVLHLISNDVDETSFEIPVLGQGKDIAATAVIGQATFNGQQISTNGSITAGPSGSAVSPSGRFALCDQTAHRVLLWDAVPSGNGTPATVVVGKASLTDTSAGTSQVLTGICDGVAFSPDGKLLVSDSGNHRVLIWNSIPVSDGAPADLVIGQTDFTSATSGLSNAKFNYPAGILVTPTGKLLVADYGNNRVLIFNQIPTANGAAADTVIGQSGLSTKGIGNSATQMNQPWGLSMAPAPDGRLLIADMGNNRILVFNTVPAASGQPADAVIGQTQFGVSTGGASQTKLAGPNGAAVALDGRVAISDYGNNRVLLFPSLDSALWGAAAAEVLGQPDFVTYTGAAHGVSAVSLLKPYPPIFTPDGRLMVPGRYMRRALVFGAPAPAPVVEQPLGNVLQSHASSVSFGDAVVNASTNTRTFTIRNAGGDTLTGLAVSKAGASASDFSVNTAGMALSLPPGASTTFDVTLAPGGEAGTRNAALYINSNVAAGPITVAITGTGSTPAASFRAWAASSGLSGSAAAPAAAPRPDGTKNLLKYAFNLDDGTPGAPVLTPGSDKGLPAIQLQAGNGNVLLRFEYLRRVGSGLVYSPTKSASLAGESWVPLTSSPQISPVNAGWERVVYEEPVTTPLCFGRLEVTLPP